MRSRLGFPAFCSLLPRLLGSAFAIAAAVPLYSFAAETSKPAEIDFGRVIRPILAGNCFKCHGPDDGDRQAGLRLDSHEGATAEADSGLPAIIPGDPTESELIRRVFSDDDADRMPPPDSNKHLSAAE